MDFIRFPYTTKCRFFRDSPIEADIKWYAAPEGAKCFPAPHKFGSLRWVSEPWLAAGLGEVYDEPDTFNGAAAPPGLVGDHYYGNLDGFTSGIVYDPDILVPRNDFGLALDCLPPELLDVMLMEEIGEPPVLGEEEDEWILLESQP